MSEIERGAASNETAAVAGRLVLIPSDEDALRMTEASKLEIAKVGTLERESNKDVLEPNADWLELKEREANTELANDAV